MTAMRTKRRYAHELYPHGEEYEVRPLRVEVPYLYARAIGFEVRGTGWFDLRGTDEQRREAGGRTQALIDARLIAFMADAIQQGLTQQAAWVWANERASEESGELVYERAVLYGVDTEAIKPYPCGPEPDHHNHYGEPDSRGWQLSARIPLKESLCADCCEPVPEADTPLPIVQEPPC